MDTINTFISPKELNIIEQFRLEKTEKPSLSKTIDLIDKKNNKLLQTLKTTNSQIQKLKQKILLKKLSEKEISELYDDTKKLSGGIKSLTEGLSHFEIDDIYFKKIIQKFQDIQKELSEIKDILKTYIDVQQSQKDVANGNTLSYDEIWNDDL